MAKALKGITTFILVSLVRESEISEFHYVVKALRSLQVQKRIFKSSRKKPSFVGAMKYASAYGENLRD